MEGRTPNPIAQLLVSMTSRRQALKGLAGGLLATTLAGKSAAHAQSKTVNDLLLANARFAANEFPNASSVPGRIYVITEAIHEADVYTEAQTNRLRELDWQGTYSTAAFVPTDRPNVFETSWYPRFDLFTNSSNAGKWARARAKIDAELPGAVDYSADGADLGDDFWHVQLDFAAPDDSTDRIQRASAGWRFGTVVANLTYDYRGDQVLQPADVRRKIARLNNEIEASVTANPALGWLPLPPGAPRADVSVGRVDSRFVPNLASDEAGRQLTEQFSAGAEIYVTANMFIPAENVGLFYSFTAYPTEEAAAARVSETLERLKPGDERNNITRRIATFPSPIAGQFDQAVWDAFIWETPNGRLAGVELTVRSGNVVATISLFGPLDAQSGATIEELLKRDDTLGQAFAIAGIITELGQRGSEPTVLEQYGLGTRISRFSPDYDPARAPGPDGYVNLGGVPLTALNYATLKRTPPRLARARGTYIDIAAGGDYAEFPSLSSYLRRNRVADSACLMVGARYEDDTLIDPHFSGINWMLTRDDAYAAFDQSQRLLSPIRESAFAAPGDFAGRPWFGGVFDGRPMGPGYPRRVSAGLAPVGTTNISVIVPGEDEGLVGAAMSLMLNALLGNTVAGNGLSRLSLLPTGPNWRQTGDHYYSHLNGDDLPGLDDSDELRVINASWNARQTAVLNAGLRYDLIQEDATAWFTGIQRNHESEELASDFAVTFKTRYERDRGVALTPVEPGGSIRRDKTFFFTSYQELANDRRQGALHMVGQTRTFTTEQTFSLEVGRSAFDRLDWYLRDGGRPLAESGSGFLDKQLTIFDEGKLGQFRETVTLFDDVFPQNPADDPANATGPAGYANLPGGLVYATNFTLFGGAAADQQIADGRYRYLDDNLQDDETITGFPVSATTLRDAGAIDVAYLQTASMRNDAGEAIDPRQSAWAWTVTPNQAYEIYQLTADALSGQVERQLESPDAFQDRPYTGFILNQYTFRRSSFDFQKRGLPLGQDSPQRTTFAVAPAGTIVMTFAAPGENEALVAAAMTLMLERLLNDEVPGDFLGRKIVFPEGPDWSANNRFYYTRLNGEDQPILGMSAEDAATVARRNAGQRSILQSRNEYITGREDAAAGLDIVLRVFDEVEGARAFVDDYPAAFEADFGFPPAEVDLRERIPGSNRSRAFLTSRARSDGVQDDALVTIARIGSIAAVLRLGMLSLQSASDTRDQFLRDGAGPLVEIGRAFMTEQVRVLDENDLGVHRLTVTYSL